MKINIIYTIIIIWLLAVLSTTNKELKRNYEKGYNARQAEITKLLKENEELGDWNIECHDYWEDRYNMRSEKDHEELLIYVDYYVRQKNIIEGMLDDKNLIQNKESWQINYASLYEDFCFGCSPHKERHKHLLKEVESQAGCNNCY